MLLKKEFGDGLYYLYPYTHTCSGNGIWNSKVTLPWYNCFAFGNGVESDRIRDDFNENTIYPYIATGKTSGFKASIPNDDYQEQTQENKNHEQGHKDCEMACCHMAFTEVKPVQIVLIEPRIFNSTYPIYLSRALSDYREELLRPPIA